MRHGNFSSSEIYKLIPTGSRKMTPDELVEHKKNNPKSLKKNIDAGFSQLGLTYIKQKKQERRLKRSLSKEHNSRPTSWGTFVESIAFEKLPIDYQLVSQIRDKHETLPWSGMADIKIPSEGIVGDIKCPYSLESFCDLYEYIETDTLKENKPEFYWQLVSNSILSKLPFAELWIYCPLEKDLEYIREKAQNIDYGQNKVAFINWSEDNELPYIFKDSDYDSMKGFRFEVPIEDIDFLTSRVILATEYLTK